MRSFAPPQSNARSGRRATRTRRRGVGIGACAVLVAVGAVGLVAVGAVGASAGVTGSETRASFGGRPHAGAPMESCRAGVLRVMTFNIHYAEPADGPNAWVQRRKRVADLIRFHAPDVLGMQEVLIEQLRYLEDRLPAYDWVGVGREDGNEAGEFSPLFFRADRFEMLDSGTFWLSERPESAGSTGWDAAFPRIATWARLADRFAGDTILVLNTHFDHRGEAARLESARLIVRRGADLARGAAVLVMGDLNALPGSPPLEALTSCPAEGACLVDGRAASESPPIGPEATYMGYEVAARPGRRLDYVLVGPGFTVVRHAHLALVESGRYPSDHIPVLADLRRSSPAAE